MNVLRLRPIAHTILRRTYSTAAPFIPPASLDDMDPHPATATARTATVTKPGSPTFYTARSDFYDSIRMLEDALQSAQQALRAVHLWPLPDTTLIRPPQHQHTSTWKSPTDIAQTLGVMLTRARYRRVQGLLTQLHDMRRIAHTGAEDAIAQRIGDVLEVFERANGIASTVKAMTEGVEAATQLVPHGARKPVPFDQHGRTYTLGKRKESAARVWMIPVHLPVAKGEAVQQPQPQPQQQQQLQQGTHRIPPNADTPPPEATTTTPGLTTPPIRLVRPGTTSPIQTTTILVNNLPLATYFPNTLDRQHIVRPFKLTGLLGAFNVFALVRGGGTTGQAGALAHGIAKGLVAHVPDVDLILRRAKLLKRDPRMVERKKTGLAKSRKRYAWVKR